MGPPYVSADVAHLQVLHNITNVSIINIMNAKVRGQQGPRYEESKGVQAPPPRSLVPTPMPMVLHLSVLHFHITV